MSSHNASLKKVKLSEVINDISDINTELASILSDIDPEEKIPLYLLSYPFGSYVIKKGVLQIPNKSGSLVSITDKSISNNIKNDLSYNAYSNPVSIVKKNCSEIFIEANNRTIPLYPPLHRGSMLSIWRPLNRTNSFQPAFLWNMSAGARSIFLLSKIARQDKHNRLCEHYKIRCDKPAHMIDHWRMFKEIFTSEFFNSKWNYEAILFSKSWFDFDSNKKLQPLYNYMLNYAWNNSEYWRNKSFLDLVYSEIKTRQNIETYPNITSAVEHLLAIGIGAIPGFKPTFTDECGPISAFIDAYKSIYRLDDIPVMMKPAMLTDECNPVYYSLNYPTNLAYSPNIRKTTRNINELKEIDLVLTKYLDELSKSSLNLQGTPLDKVTSQVKFDVFHVEKQVKKSALKSANNIFADDQIINCQLNSHHLGSLPSSSPFFNGCIKITKN